MSLLSACDFVIREAEVLAKCHVHVEEGRSSPDVYSECSVLCMFRSPDLSQAQLAALTSEFENLTRKSWGLKLRRVVHTTEP